MCLSPAPVTPPTPRSPVPVAGGGASGVTRRPFRLSPKSPQRSRPPRRSPVSRAESLVRCVASRGSDGQVPLARGSQWERCWKGPERSSRMKHYAEAPQNDVVTESDFPRPPAIMGDRDLIRSAGDYFRGSDRRRMARRRSAASEQRTNCPSLRGPTPPPPTTPASSVSSTSSSSLSLRGDSAPAAALAARKKGTL